MLRRYQHARNIDSGGQDAPRRVPAAGLVASATLFRVPLWLLVNGEWSHTDISCAGIPTIRFLVAYEQEELTSRNLPQISPNLPPLSAQTLDW